MVRSCSRSLFCSRSFLVVLPEKSPVTRQFFSSAVSCQGWGRGFESHRPLQQNQDISRFAGAARGCCDNVLITKPVS
jgi:hypothetical protein